MNITRTINPATCATKENISLSAAEIAAVDQALEIIHERCEHEGISRDAEFDTRVEFWLLGILRSDDNGCRRTSEEDGIAAMLDKARNTPFSKKPTHPWRGYATKGE